MRTRAFSSVGVVILGLLLWQAAYAELYFTPVLWPDFGPDDLLAAIVDYQGRERRFGDVSATPPPALAGS